MIWWALLYPAGNIVAGKPRVIQRTHGVSCTHESPSRARSSSRLASAHGRTGILPSGGSTTIDRRRALVGLSWSVQCAGGLTPAVAGAAVGAGCATGAS